jgi:hypothetical protein
MRVTPAAHPPRQRFVWPLQVAIVIVVLAGGLTLSSPYFSIVDFLVTIVTVAVVAFVLRRPPTSLVQKLLYFQLVFLMGLYVAKGLNIAWALTRGAFEVLPAPLRLGPTAEEFSTVFQMSCAVCILLAGLLALAPARPRENTRAQLPAFNPMVLIFATLGLFAVSLLLRLAPIGGLPGSLIYVISHRSTPFAFALLVYMLLERGETRLARRMFGLWLSSGIIMFGLFGSKSYIFLPVVFLISVYFLSGTMILHKKIVILLGMTLISIYPFLNFYRSLHAESGVGYMDVLDFWSMYSRTQSGADLAELLPIYVNQILGRLVGIEWFLVIIHSETLGSLPESQGIFANTLAINDVMRVLAGREGQNIGIAPSFIGATYLIARDPLLAPILALVFCASFVWIYRGLQVAFVSLKTVVVAPLLLISFSVITDGLVTSLYWDLPALCVVCFLFSALVKRTRRDGWPRPIATTRRSLQGRRPL